MVNKEECFNRLIDEQLPMLRRAAYHLLRNVADVDDAVQEALLKAWKAFDSIKTEDKLVGWVYRITINSCYDIIRKRQKQVELQEDYVDDSGNDGENEKKMLVLERAIEQLPEEFREAIIVGVLLNLPGSEAANRLGCSVDALYQRISRAKHKIRDLMVG